jgi:hypothetical protein
VTSSNGSGRKKSAVGGQLRFEKSIGRIGALAVALGVGLGIAVPASCGIAQAAPADSNGHSAVGHGHPKVHRQPAGAAQHSVRVKAVGPAQVTPGNALALAVPRVTVKSIVTDSLTWAGLGKLTPLVPLPDVPVPSFVEGLWLGVRQFERSVNNQKPISRPTVSGQDPDGTITGNLNVVDFEGDSLTYSVSKAPANGSVSVDADGMFTYTPGDPVGIAGGRDVFTIEIGDGANHGLLGLGAGPTLVKVAVAVAPFMSNPVIVTGSSTLSDGGGIYANPLLNADGTRAVVTTSAEDAAGHRYTTRVTVIDTSTGGQVAPTFAIDGRLDDVALSTDGARAIVTISDWDSPFSRVAVIDTATGDQIGATVELSGSQYHGVVLSADKTRALLTAFDEDSGTSRAAVVDTKTGAQIGTAVTVDGAFHSAELVADGSRFVMATTGSDPGTSRVVVVDTETGARIGTTVVLDSPDYTVLGEDGIHVVLSGSETDSGPSRLAVVDTTTGGQIGTTVTLPTGSYARLSPDGTRVVVTAVSGGKVAGGLAAQLMVVDLATGAQAGSAVTVTIPYTSQAVAGFDRGFWDGPLLNGDGTRAVFYSDSNSGFTNRNTARMIVVDTVTGQIGNTIALSGIPAVLTTPDGSRALLAASGRIAVVDTATGIQVGRTVVIGGGYPDFAAVGTRVVVALQNGNDTRLAVIDTATGTQLGGTVDIDGSAADVVLSADGARAFVTTYDYVSEDSRVTVVDTVAGTQVGATLVVPGFAGTPVLSADGNHAVVPTASSDALTVTSFQIGGPGTLSA